MREKTSKDIEQYIQKNKDEDIKQLKVLIDVIESDKKAFIREKKEGTIDC